MSRAVVDSRAVTDSFQYVCRVYVYCSDQIHEPVRLICPKEPTQMNHSFTNRTSLQDRYGGVLTCGCGSGKLRWMWLSSMILPSRGQSSHHPRGTRIGNVIQILILLLADPLLGYYTYILLDAIVVHCTGDGSDRDIKRKIYSEPLCNINNEISIYVCVIDPDWIRLINETIHAGGIHRHFNSSEKAPLFLLPLPPLIYFCCLPVCECTTFQKIKVNVLIWKTCAWCVKNGGLWIDLQNGNMSLLLKAVCSINKDFMDVHIILRGKCQILLASLVDV